MRIKIEKLIYEGWGIGRDKTGRVVLVRKSVPGDELEIKIIKNKKSYSQGAIVDIIKPSSIRVKPPCPYFSKCGGCDHQNIAYDNQLILKTAIFKEILQREEIDLKPFPIMAGSAEPFFYRNSIRFFFVSKPDGMVSFARHNADQSQSYVEIDRCLLHSEKCNEILIKLKDYLNENIKEKGMFWQLKIREGKYTGEFMVEIITSGEGLPSKEGIVDVLKNIKNIKSVYHTIAPGKSLKQMRRHLLFGAPIIHEKIGAQKFQISPESFFQTNSLGIKTLYDKIKEFAVASPKDTVLDLYCGTGTIGIYLSTLAKKVVGVEIAPAAIRDARDNARTNHIHNCEFICDDVKSWLENNLSTFDFRLSTIVVDPPRAGLTPKIIKLLSHLVLSHSLTKIIYVSCNPATFARDIAEFRKYQILLTKVQPIDMFPHTHHIECVGLLKKAGLGCCPKKVNRV